MSERFYFRVSNCSYPLAKDGGFRASGIIGYKSHSKKIGPRYWEGFELRILALKLGKSYNVSINLLTVSKVAKLVI